MSYGAVLFDLDGTLLDTLQDIGDAMNRTLASKGYPLHTLDSYRYYVGEGARLLVERAIPESERTPETIDALLTRYLEDYGRNWAVHTQPYPGIPETCTFLNDTRIAISVLSNKPHETTVACVAQFLPQVHFARVYGQLPGMNRKPDPAMALRIAAELGIAPQRFLYVGDTATDMQTATRAGMTPVGVSWGFRPVRELLQQGAAHVVDRPSDLIQILSSNTFPERGAATDGRRTDTI